ncbi:hypothetical protein E3T55_19470 [Cryobacterium frigoriphilum]|uniref:AbiEi antitoxin C-terminal domain-containing protein n=1 Tax=Cryobacterium frigoriphilum TaxID=1259150 RepID=A0A4R8ZTJ3_9MICO|nr:hypothetical protein [Cryobacterium frigoriphilum]TFD45191.1 hypothetical protein E3T55_19470 [Cryobacterium frigoriphilum]
MNSDPPVRLRSVPPPPPPPHDLALAELCSARLDGEIYLVGDVWYPIDEIDSPASRARTISRLVPVAVVAERSSAAWIFGLAPEPCCHELHLDSGARKRVPLSLRVRVREVRDPLAETLTIGGVCVTTPLRTAVDLALCRTNPAGDCEEARLVDLLAALLRYGGYRTVREALHGCVPALSPSGQRAAARFRAVQDLFDDETLPGRRRPSSAVADITEECT